MAAGRVVLTHDSDFGTLAVAKNEPTAGIIYPRPGHIDATLTIRSIESLFNQELDLEAPFLVVVEHATAAIRVRVRRL